MLHDKQPTLKRDGDKSAELGGSAPLGQQKRYVQDKSPFYEFPVI